MKVYAYDCFCLLHIKETESMNEQEKFVVAKNIFLYFIVILVSNQCANKKHYFAFVFKNI